MENTEYFFSGNAWFKQHLDGPDGYFWKKARKMFLFKHELSSAVNLFRFNSKAIEVISRPEGIVLHGSRNTDLNANEEDEYRPGQSWTDDAQNSIRTLLDCVVTRWNPKFLPLSRINVNRLHRTLTPVPLQYVQKTYDTTDDDVDKYDVDRALSAYQQALVPLQYHELWSEIVSDYKNVETKLEERETIINFSLFYDKTTLDEQRETALMFGTNRVTYADSYKPLSRNLGLFDVVFIKINNVNYFGMIVHVEQNKVKVADENNTTPSHTEKEALKFELLTTIGIYVSRKCSTLIQEQYPHTKEIKLPVFKLSNITSSRRMISAIHNLHEWPQHRSLLKPTIDDAYFQFPQDYNPLYINPAKGFNQIQSETIALAECMYDDLLDRMHIVHGPPGTGKSRTIAGIVLKLLAKLPESGRKHKILLCAPSNNACDELARRILDEFDKQEVSFKRDTLVRVGCQPPDDFRLCDHFLDFMVLKDMVNVLKSEEKINDNIAQQTENRIMRHAKIVISTLNYCGSNRLHQLKGSTAFVIIDEASQSLEADLLLPLRFKCNKIMLVGDPKQLPPCVLSDAGKDYGLSLSLYSRLYSIFANHSNRPITMLDTQYRMHPDICEFPSDYFYSGRLRTDSSVATRMRHFPLKPLYVYNITNSLHTYDAAKSSYNEGEAKCIQTFCQKLITYLAHQPVRNSSDSGISDDDDDDDDDDGSSTSSSSDSTDNSDDESEYEQEIERRGLQPLPYNDPRSIDIQQKIAVITPYKAQVRLLRNYLPPYIEIMTVDSSQGKEKDYVIVSCVRSGDNIGFLDDMNRVNVMITRSKNALYVFGNLTHLARHHECWRALDDHARKNRIICDSNSISPDLPYRS